MCQVNAVRRSNRTTVLNQDQQNWRSTKQQVSHYSLITKILQHRICRHSSASIPLYHFEGEAAWQICKLRAWTRLRYGKPMGQSFPGGEQITEAQCILRNRKVGSYSSKGVLCWPCSWKFRGPFPPPTSPPPALKNSQAMHLSTNTHW